MSFWGDKKVLVTGAGGFMGSHLVEALAREGARVRAFVRYNSRSDAGALEFAGEEIKERVDFFRGDIRDRDSVRKAVEGRELVFHLAALIAIPYSYGAPSSYVETNVAGTLNLLEESRLAGVGRFVHTSTSEVYGTAKYVPIDEEHPLCTQSPYSASKAGADHLTLSYRRSFDFPVLIIRPFNTYGPRQSARAIIPTIITQALFRPTVELGELGPRRDFTYVDDMVRGFLLGGSTPGMEGETINLGSEREISIGELAEKIMSVVGVKKEIREDTERKRPPGSEVERLLSSASKARRMLGWSPEVGHAEGLERTVAWIRENRARYKPGIYTL